MKKLLYVLLGVSLILLACTYLFIPDEIVISETEQVESSERIVAKYFKGEDQILQWWPGEKKRTAPVEGLLRYGNNCYHFLNPKFNSLDITIETENSELNSTVSWIPYSKNLIRLTWKASLYAGKNPVKRFLRFQQAREIKAEITHILKRYLTFIVNSRNVYGYDFKIQTVADTVLATTKFISAAYPENSRIYQEINKVKAYLDRQSVKASKSPMLNISRDAQGQYETTLALPVTKRFESSDNILMRRMVAGNILVAEVKGGPRTVSNGFSQMETFMKDYKLSSPAIYFESLITDRSLEADTAKWITKIYYPIY